MTDIEKEIEDVIAEPVETRLEKIRMSDDALREFVNGYCSGDIYTNYHLPSSDFTVLVFMPLALGALKYFTQVELELIGCIWERLSTAGPRSINGCPTFFSCRLMHADDWKRAKKAIVKELKRRKEIEL